MVPDLNLKVMTMNGCILEKQVDSVSLLSLDNSRMAVLKGHCPVTALLAPGIIYSLVRSSNKVNEQFKCNMSSGGFVEVVRNNSGDRF